MLDYFVLLANFLAPEEIGTTPQSLLFMLPLVASIAVVYKATKLQKITAGRFFKESILLFTSIVVFVLVTAVILYVLARLITG